MGNIGIKYISLSTDESDAFKSLYERINHLVNQGSELSSLSSKNRFNVSIWKTWDYTNVPNFNVHLSVYTDLYGGFETRKVILFEDSVPYQYPGLDVDIYYNVHEACRVLENVFLREVVGFYLLKMSEADELTRAVVHSLNHNIEKY